MKKKLFAVVLLCSVVLAGCGKQDNKNTIYTSVYALENMYNTLTNGTINVQSIYPEGVDAHDYELTAKELEAVINAKGFTFVSTTFEKYAQKISEYTKEKSDFYNLELAEVPLFKENVSSNNYTDGKLKDPHVWLSPKKALVILEIIYEEALKINPSDKNYQKTYDKLKKQLSEVGHEYTEFAKKQTKPIFVAHDAYYWLRQDYGMNVVGIFGADHHDEPTAKEISTIIAEVKAQQVKAIYTVVDELNNKTMLEIAEATGAKIVALDNMETKTKDTRTFVEILEGNLKAMKEA